MIKILKKNVYRPTETQEYALFVQSQAPLNNTTLRVTFLQSQQPVTTHSVSPLMLPFFPTPNHQTRLLIQKNPKTSSPQNENNFYVLPSLRHSLHSNSWKLPKSLPILKLFWNPVILYTLFFCWSTEFQTLQCLFNPKNQITQKIDKKLRRRVLLQL